MGTRVFARNISSLVCFLFSFSIIAAVTGCTASITYSKPGGVRQFEYSATLTPFDDTTNFQQQGTRGTSPFISANGTGYGIVWMIDQGNPLQNSSGAAPTKATLRAYDAANFPNEIYNSDTNRVRRQATASSSVPPWPRTAKCISLPGTISPPPRTDRARSMSMD